MFLFQKAADGYKVVYNAAQRYRYGGVTRILKEIGATTLTLFQSRQSQTETSHMLLSKSRVREALSWVSACRQGKAKTFGGN